MYYRFLLLLIPILVSCNPQNKEIPLFNGTDLSNWHSDVPEQDTNATARDPFIMRDGNLVSLGTPRGHLITNESYRNYMLDVEYRFTGEAGNCGVLVHASTPRVLSKMFPKSIEVQMFSGEAGDFWCIGENIEVENMIERRGPENEWGVTGGKKRRILNLTDNSENSLGEWNHMHIECLNEEVKVWVNEDFVNHGYNCTASEGQIAIQAEGAEVEFRKVVLKPISEFSH